MTACVFLLFLSLAPGVGWTADKLGVLYSALSVSYSMPWIAREAGLFRKYNLDVDLVYIPSSGVANAALLGGDVEVALAGGIGTVRAYVQGASDLVFIGGFKNALTHSIVAKPEIKTTAELKGKKNRRYTDRQQQSLFCRAGASSGGPRCRARRHYHSNRRRAGNRCRSDQWEPRCSRDHNAIG